VHAVRTGVIRYYERIEDVTHALAAI